MEPRTDSRLTELFCTDKLSEDWTADIVVRELVATDFLFKNTLYGEILEDFMRMVAYELRRRYRLTWTKTWEIVKFYAPIALKLLCLERSGLMIPNNIHVPCVE
jgi:hypothetical protein